MQEKDAKGIIRDRKSKKDSQHNIQKKKKYKRTNNDLQTTAQKLNTEQHRYNWTPRENSCAPEGCSTTVTLRVTHDTNLIISHECGKDRILITKNGTYPPWSFVT